MGRMTGLLAAMATGVGMAQPAWADWSHKASGITLPEQVGDMKRGETRDISSGKESDVILQYNSIQYGAGPTAVSVYVYRSSYPNPALWFGRTLAAIPRNVGPLGASQPPRDFMLAGAPRPNGRRASFDIVSGDYTATAVAFVQVNEWMLKIRISSKMLDRAAIDAQMDQLLGAARFTRPVTDPLPLIVPAPCTEERFSSGRPLQTGNAPERITEAAIIGLIVESDARGRTGLAREPDTWCEVRSALPAAAFASYRRKDGDDMVVFVADSGRAIETHSVSKTKGETGPVGLYGSTANETMLIALFDGPPDMDLAVRAALPSLMGQAPNLVTVSTTDEKSRKR